MTCKHIVNSKHIKHNQIKQSENNNTVHMYSHGWNLLLLFIVWLDLHVKIKLMGGWVVVVGGNQL